MIPSSTGGKATRVLEVTHGLGLGGAEVALVSRLQHAPAEVQTTVINTKPGLNALADDLSRTGVVIREVPTPNRMRRLISFIRALSPDIIIAHSPTDVVLLLLAKAVRLIDCPVVVVAHSERARQPFRAVLPLINRYAALHVAVSNRVSRSIQCRGARSIHVVYLGARSHRGECDWPDLDGGPVFLFVGRLIPSKRLDLLIAATIRLSPSLRQTGGRVIVAGDGPEFDRARFAVSAHALEDVIELRGFVRPISDLLAAGDALVVASDYEGLPIAVFEALMAGLVIVSTDVGGIRELIGESTEHVLVPPGDAEALQHAMASVIANYPDLRRTRYLRRKLASKFDSRELSRDFYAAVSRVSYGRSSVRTRRTGGNRNT